MDTTLGFNAMVHDGVPVLPGQDLQRKHRCVNLVQQYMKERRLSLTCTWKTVRMAAGNVSKLVVGVSSLKLNLRDSDNQSLDTEYYASTKILR